MGGRFIPIATNPTINTIAVPESSLMLPLDLPLA
jgi:hypothetical protein